MKQVCLKNTALLDIFALFAICGLKYSLEFINKTFLDFHNEN